MNDAMFYAFEQEVPIGEDLYRKIMERLGPEPLEGLLVHLAVRSGDGMLRYVDVWTSKEACDRAFEERIHPAVAATFAQTGFRPSGEPTRRSLQVVDLTGALRGTRER
jgi:hypothetical protein